MQSARGVTGVVDAIDASLAQRRDNLKPLFESEEDGYRALLREVIESRQGGGNVDLSHLRREKKKKREAERGGSKGRKLRYVVKADTDSGDTLADISRYTVHDKAVNFVVPIPLDQAWHEEQVDELFASLFGGVGIKGALSDMGTSEGAGAVTDLGGLQVF
jgi:protein AATF/BFR2